MDVQGGIKARVLWFRYAFVKQYCKLKGQGSGRGYSGQQMGDTVCGRDCC